MDRINKVLLDDVIREIEQHELKRMVFTTHDFAVMEMCKEDIIEMLKDKFNVDVQL